MITSVRVLLGIRVLGIAASACIAAWHPYAVKLDALSAALYSLAVMMCLHLFIDLTWAHLLKSGGSGSSPNVAVAWGPFVGLIVTTAGVVLGLVQVFNPGSLSVALKVGTLSLAISVMLGMILFGLVVSAAPNGAVPIVVRAVVFNATLCALSLGLLAVAWTDVLR
jgi:hypothetical protein